MDPEERRLLKQLLFECRVATLAVLVDNAPYTGLVPYAPAEDGCAAYVHVSALARHSAGMSSGAPFSLLIHAPLTPETDPLQVPRLSLQGRMEHLEHDSPAYATGAARYLERFPQSQVTFSFRDFSLYRLSFTHGRFVAGFARAYNVTPALLRGLVA